MTEYIGTQMWRYVGGVLKAPGRSDRAVGPFTVTAPVNPGGGGTGGGGGTVPTDNFVLRQTKPDATNTGVPAGWAPNRTFTNQQILTNGMVIEDVQFDCPVDFQGTGIVLRRCLIRGTPSTSGRPLINATASACNNGTQNVLERCEVAPQNVTNTTDCLFGFNYRTLRSEFYHGVDTSGTYIPPTVGTVANVLHQGSYFHDQAYFCPDVGGQATGQTHNDGNQHHNGTGVTFEGCFMSGFFAPDVGVGALDPGVFHLTATNARVWDSGNYNSPGVANGPRNINGCFQVNDIAVADDLHYLYNWIEGGISTWNILDTKLAIKTMEIVGNRVGLPKSGKGAILNAYSAASAIVTASGNTLADGTPLSLTVGDGRTNKT